MGSWKCRKWTPEYRADEYNQISPSGRWEHACWRDFAPTGGTWVTATIQPHENEQDWFWSVRAAGSNEDVAWGTADKLSEAKRDADKGLRIAKEREASKAARYGLSGLRRRAR
jgi:hypothetical protein